MPIGREAAEHFLGHPDPESMRVVVRTDSYGSTAVFTGKVIPMDGRSYIFQGKTILSNQVRIHTKFEIDTGKSSLLVSKGLWHIDGVWYFPFEADALEALGLSPDEPTEFSWVPNVPLDTLGKPPYVAGRPIRRKWWKRTARIRREEGKPWWRLG
jgi:hypothetical protein